MPASTDAESSSWSSTSEGDSTFTSAARSSSEGAHREDGVVVAEDQDLRLATALPVDVGPGAAGDEFAPTAEVPLDHAGEQGCGELELVEHE